MPIVTYVGALAHRVNPGVHRAGPRHGRAAHELNRGAQAVLQLANLGQKRQHARLPRRALEHRGLHYGTVRQAMLNPLCAMSL